MNPWLPKPQFCQTDIMVLFSLIVTCFDIVSVKQRADTDRPSPDGERRSPSEDEADEKTSSAEIHNAEDHKEIFQPKNHICMLNRFFFLSLPTLFWFDSPIVNDKSHEQGIL